MSTYLCPASCVMVKAVPSPLSAFMVQLKNFLHMPSIGAKPVNNKQYYYDVFSQ